MTTAKAISSNVMQMIGTSFLRDDPGAPERPKVAIWRKSDGFGFETGRKGWRVRVGYEAEWLRYHSSYSVFLTVIPPHADICDLWAGGRQPRSASCAMMDGEGRGWVSD